MRRLVKFWKIIVLDSLGLIFMVAALLTGWLPGPGGIPLFIIGLSLLAINHTWAQRYIDLLRQYADRLGDIIFVKNPVIQAIYDILAVLLASLATLFFVRHSALWLVSAGVFLVGIAGALFLGNRGRWHMLKRAIKHKN